MAGWRAPVDELRRIFEGLKVKKVGTLFSFFLFVDYKTKGNFLWIIFRKKGNCQCFFAFKKGSETTSSIWSSFRFFCWEMLHFYLKLSIFPSDLSEPPLVFEATESPLKKGMLVMIPNFYVPLSRSRSEPFARKLGFQRTKIHQGRKPYWDLFKTLLWQGVLYGFSLRRKNW